MGDDFYKINVHNTKLHIFILSTVNNKKNNQKQKQTKAPKNNHRIKAEKQGLLHPQVHFPQRISNPPPCVPGKKQKTRH